MTLPDPGLFVKREQLFGLQLPEVKVCQRLTPRRYPEPGVYPACFPEPRSRTIVRVPRPGPIPARLQATGGKRLNIILVCERGATEPEQIFGYPDPRKARLGPLRAFRSPRRWVCGPTRQAQPRSVRLFANFC